MGKYLVIGASGDIGSQITRDLLMDGHEVIAQYFSADIKQLKEQFNGQAISFFQLDLSVPLQKNPFDTWMTAHLDGLIYVAGKSYFSELRDVTDDKIHEQYAIHFFNLVKCVQFTSSGLLQVNNGRIIVISSIWGETGSSMESIYSGFKAAQIGFIKSIAKEYAQTNITANIIAPGLVSGAMTDALEDDVHDIIEQIPQKKCVQPADISHFVRSLLHPHAHTTTGTVIRINGGWYI
ncbi:SDR family NAD(P)-dependent oxidoreductase [Macrococcoides canis]|uniref:SDR family NAD(P)-dependent oxidoreductase n=1 Tax=Macrococcoides canis TaxID=1855823 RepID=UPI0010FC1E71|nr:SDR family oxidoreductase [Macrococcus canis]QCT74707.1 SDR family oxidoreductase [Macrococcus canis]QNR07725.1 SDR family NAD(P)-dependent oxidoreductase [Macrococcus canis]